MRHGYRVRQCSIVEEDEDEEEEEEEEEEEGESEELGGTRMPVKGLSRHSSTSSLADGSSCKASPSLHLDLTLAFAAQRLVEDAAAPTMPTPAPFPPSSQIGEQRRDLLEAPCPPPHPSRPLVR
jgi:hypothetical protein